MSGQRNQANQTNQTDQAKQNNQPAGLMKENRYAMARPPSGGFLIYRRLS
ncbi:MAG: hypothetical protein OJF50_001844 [Nitrospira sp.]|nr:hypothetical protein [Nitrospira sp.]